MARNHVWRYTLRLFHTFAFFEKIEKSMPKASPNVMHFDEKRSFGAQGSIYSAILVDLWWF